MRSVARAMPSCSASTRWVVWALIGGAIAFAISETLGLIAGLWPQAWLALFSPDPRVIETGSAYLRIVGPAYGFFGLGMALGGALLLVDLVGFTGSGFSHTSWKNFGENVPERAARVAGAGIIFRPR